MLTFNNDIVRCASNSEKNYLVSVQVCVMVLKLCVQSKIGITLTLIWRLCRDIPAETENLGRWHDIYARQIAVLHSWFVHPEEKMHDHIMSDGVECRRFKNEHNDGRGLGTKATKCASGSHCATYTPAFQCRSSNYIYPQQALEKEKNISANKVIYVPVC